MAVALALSGLGMGVAMPSSSSVMANEVKTNEFGVMSAAQMLAMQVGEVAGIQVLETIQQALVRRRGLSHAKPGPALLATFHLPVLIGACVGAIGLRVVALHSIGPAQSHQIDARDPTGKISPMNVDIMPGCEPLSFAGSDRGVLVLHGFTGNPSSMRSIAERAAAPATASSCLDFPATAPRSRT